MLTLFVDSDTVIRWDKMTDVDTENIVSNATVEMNILNTDLESVSSGINMTLVDGFDGRYHGTVSYETALTVGETYYVEITATWGTVIVKRLIEARAQYLGQ